MPEGDTIFRAARTLNRALAGHVVTRFESVFPHLTRVHEGTPITVRRPDSPQALAFRDLAAAVRMRLDEVGGLGSLPKIS